MVKKEAKDRISLEFKEAVERYADCPEDVFRLAKTEYQIAVAVELFKNDKDHAVFKTEFNNIKKLLYLILSVTGAIGFGLLIERLVSSLL